MESQAGYGRSPNAEWHSTVPAWGTDHGFPHSKRSKHLLRLLWKKHRVQRGMGIVFQLLLIYKCLSARIQVELTYFLFQRHASQQILESLLSRHLCLPVERRRTGLWFGFCAWTKAAHRHAAKVQVSSTNRSIVSKLNGRGSRYRKFQRFGIASSPFLCPLHTTDNSCKPNLQRNCIIRQFMLWQFDRKTGRCLPERNSAAVAE